MIFFIRVLDISEILAHFDDFLIFYMNQDQVGLHEGDDVTFVSL